MKATTKENNLRTCFACGEKRDKGRLLRFVAAGELIVPDWRATLDGRALYACPTAACVDRFYTQKRFPEKFFAGTPVFAVARGEIRGWVRSQADVSLAHFLGLARKSGVLTAGQNTLADAFAHGTAAPAVVLLATDLAERTVRDMTGAIPDGVPVLRWGTKEAIGTATGMRPTGVLALAASPITERIQHYFAIINNFSQEL